MWQALLSKKELSYLDLSDNAIGREAAILLALSPLRYLDIGDTGITGEFLVAVLNGWKV